MVDDVQCVECGRWGSKDAMINHLSNPQCEDPTDCQKYIRNSKLKRGKDGN